MTTINKEISINKSLEAAWKVLGQEFAQAGQWLHQLNTLKQEILRILMALHVLKEDVIFRVWEVLKRNCINTLIMNTYFPTRFTRVCLQWLNL